MPHNTTNPPDSKFEKTQIFMLHEQHCEYLQQCTRLLNKPKEKNQPKKAKPFRFKVLTVQLAI
jgi:hypothetical protein